VARNFLGSKSPFFLADLVGGTKGFHLRGAIPLRILSKWCATKDVHFCSELIKTAGGPNETCPSAKVLKNEQY
jgi:hypothetical protein